MHPSFLLQSFSPHPSTGATWAAMGYVGVAVMVCGIGALVLMVAWAVDELWREGRER